MTEEKVIEFQGCTIHLHKNDLPKSVGREIMMGLYQTVSIDCIVNEIADVQVISFCHPKSEDEWDIHIVTQPNDGNYIKQILQDPLTSKVIFDCKSQITNIARHLDFDPKDCLKIRGCSCLKALSIIIDPLENKGHDETIKEWCPDAELPALDMPILEDLTQEQIQALAARVYYNLLTSRGIVEAIEASPESSWLKEAAIQFNDSWGALTTLELYCFFSAAALFDPSASTL